MEYPVFYVSCIVWCLLILKLMLEFQQYQTSYHSQYCVNGNDSLWFLLDTPCLPILFFVVVFCADEIVCLALLAKHIYFRQSRIYLPFFLSFASYVMYLYAFHSPFKWNPKISQPLVHFIKISVAHPMQCGAISKTWCSPDASVRYKSMASASRIRHIWVVSKQSLLTVCPSHFECSSLNEKKIKNSIRNIWMCVHLHYGMECLSCTLTHIYLVAAASNLERSVDVIWPTSMRSWNL